ncbi:MAG: hypothetical protein LBE91_07725, partial [Tannerella sp.]|nr:hypothetical protein [Tannerella sp.]
MKLIAILIMLAALFLLYRIAYPKKANARGNGDAPPQKHETVPDVVGESRYVRPDRSQPVQAPATSDETGKG